ncbi:MAG: tail fiber domain-containing protein [Desulfurellales bacterium]|nr:MAG: tail fiber domain-containing protein [Desulfurellales bacterium]
MGWPFASGRPVNEGHGYGNMFSEDPNSNNPNKGPVGGNMGGNTFGGTRGNAGFGDFTTQAEWDRRADAINKGNESGYGSGDGNTTSADLLAERDRRRRSGASTGLDDLMGTSMRGEPSSYQPTFQGFQYGQSKTGARDATNRYQGMGGAAAGRQAYQMDPSQQNQARGYQNFAAGDYIRTLNGQNPSAARMMMERGLGQAQGNALGMAAGARGGGANSAAAMRAALASNNQMASQTNQSAGIEAAREREAARAGLASVGGQMRGQDIGWQQGQGALEMQQRGLNDSTQLGYERLGADVQAQQLQAYQNREKLAQEAELANRQQNFNVQQYNKNNAKSIWGAGGTALSALFSMSDERQKKDVTGAATFMASSEDYDRRRQERDKFQEAFEARSGPPPQATEEEKKEGGVDAGQVAGIAKMFSSDERKKKDVSGLQDFARKMEPKSYRYKWESDSAPKRDGVMAQDMEKSALGESAVVETPDGKMIDMPRAVSLALAALAEMRDELDDKKRKKG